MRKIIAELSRKYRAAERRVRFLDRALDEKRRDGQSCGQATKRSFALKHMADLAIAIEALRAIEGRDVRPIGKALG